MKIINYESDFKIIEGFKDKSPITTAPFRFSYYTKMSKRTYVAEYDGSNYTNCKPTDDGRIVVAFDNHKLGMGVLNVKREFFLTDKDFADGICNLVSVETTGITLDSGATDEIDDIVIEVFPFYQQGETGKSAYQEWLDLGNEGTVADFLASLKGDKGEDGKSFTYDDMTDAEKKDLAGHFNLEVVNNLEDGGKDKALSAEMGKRLNEMISEGGSITTEKIAAGAVTSEKIAPKSVTADQLSFATVEPIEVGTAGDSSLAILTKSGTEKTLLVPSALSLLMDENGDVVTFKTINGQPILGSGNIDIESGSGGGSGIVIVNDLTTGGTDKALSAEMGKKLSVDISGFDDALLAISPRENRHFSIHQPNDIISSAYGISEVVITPPLPAGSPITIIPDNNNFTMIKFELTESSGATHTWGLNSTDAPFGEDMVFDYNIAKIYVQSYASQKFILNVEYDNVVYLLPEKVDAAIANIGDLSDLNTDDKSNVVSAINSVNGLLGKTPKVFDATIQGVTYNKVAVVDCYMPIGGHFKLAVNTPEDQSIYIDILIGTQDNMERVYAQTPNVSYGTLEFDTSMRVERIELYAYYYTSVNVHVEYNILTMEEQIKENNTNIGDLSSLNTDDKTSLVAAANSIVRLLPDFEETTEYDVVRGCGKGVNKSNIYDCIIKKGSLVTVHPYGDVATGTNYNYYIIEAKNTITGESQTILRIVSGTWTGEGRWDTPLELKIDANQIEITSYAGVYVDIYHTRRALTIESEVRAKVPNRWYGKKWLLIGDSISTEKASYANNGYGTYVSQSLGLQKTNISVSGKTMSWGYSIIDSQPDDFDLVTVMLGTNNQGYNTSIGSLNDSYYEAGDYSTNSSFYAATQLFYEKLRRKFPKSIIVFLTPIKRRNNEGTGGGDGEVGGDQLGTQGGYNVNALGLTTKEYADVIKDVCRWYSIPCIDLYDTIDPRTEFNRKTYFLDSENGNDGTHPNDLGHALFIAPVVEDGLLRCAPYWFNDWSVSE